MSKRKWKVYTTDELKERFQPRGPAGGPHALAGVGTMDDVPTKGAVVPNLKRRNSAPPGMIHFPPGTFSGGNSPHSSPSNNLYKPSSPHQQHELVTHTRSSPTSKAQSQSHPYTGARLERRRASLPFLPPSSPMMSSLPLSHATQPPPQSIEEYLTKLASIPLPHQDLDGESDNPPLSPSTSLPSFQSLLQTIREDADEEDDEMRTIEDMSAAERSPRAHRTGPPASFQALQTSKTMPVTLKEMGSHVSPSHDPYANYKPFGIPSPQPTQEMSTSPSSKFYNKNNNSNTTTSTTNTNNNLSKSTESLPSLSRMSISDIIS